VLRTFKGFSKVVFNIVSPVQQSLGTSINLKSPGKQLSSFVLPSIAEA